ncbi:MAG: nitroreductase family protein [Defluviitaleaceae bacterium]|nr:nitroreductase family protein [Defluviitaleaceae bacterium]
MTAFEAMKNRASYRGKFESTAIPKDDLIKIMEAGLSAPSGCNKQTTSLIAVDDADLLLKLHEVINPAAAETAPAMICVLTQKIIAYRDRCFNVQDYSAAIQNMLLAALVFSFVNAPTIRHSEISRKGVNYP